MRYLFFDTETCGLHGPIVLLQYAWDDGPITLYTPWKHGAQETINLINTFLADDVCVVGFNLVFDWFHIQQMYSTLLLLEDKDTRIDYQIEEYVSAEKWARELNVAIKPYHAFDLLLHARKGPFQNLMDRKDLKIRRVPTPLAWKLAEELTARIQIDDIFFERRKTKKGGWEVVDTETSDGLPDPDFKDVVLKFAPSSALKALAKHVLGFNEKDVLFFQDVEVPFPEEQGFAPYALAPINGREPCKENNWCGKWPLYINMHVNHWSDNDRARKYASDDVKYTRALFHEFLPDPTTWEGSIDDDDSILACMVGSLRWRGYDFDPVAIRNLRDRAAKGLNSLKINFNSPRVCRTYIEEVMGPTEKMVISRSGKLSTKGTILEEVATWTQDHICDNCEGQGCENCQEGIVKGTEAHPAALRAREILDARRSKKEIEVYDKLLTAGRFHASFNIIGARSGRMSGSDDLNAQGINHAKFVRECFSLAPRGFTLCGGDLAGSQVAIADAVFQDPGLHEELLTGKKLYGIFGCFLFPGLSYDEILATKGLPGEQDKYDRSKKAVLAMLFGGEAYTLSTRVGISQEAAEDAFRRWVKRYPVWGQKRQYYFDLFCSMRQPGGIGTNVEWHDPAEYVESMFGFRRYFTLENQIVKALFDLATKPPKIWQSLRIKVVRTNREQTACGALQSALYGAAFQAQAANMRAAANHVIQSPEATIVKKIQRKIWDLQPPGVSRLLVMPLNVHDEIMCPTVPEAVEPVAQVVTDTVESFRPIIPLIGMDWKSSISSWAGK